VYRPNGERLERGGKPQRRAAGTPTPCRTCPYKSRENADKLRLSSRQWLAVRFYLRVKATRGACLNSRERRDQLTLRLLSIIDGVWSSFESDRAAGGFASRLADAIDERRANR
jgi:hypothetical protein